ncbi:MAG: hypothetical protein P4L27_07010 [Ignavibacteriaceae bacterium]|nr:hypothetical protein [Ignavibacteriaceae bacterium]
MKYLIIKIFLILVLVSSAFGGAILNYFQVKSDGDNVKLEWQTGTESNVNHFSVQRRTPQTSFVEITTIQPKGNNSFYSYEDQSIYKANDVIFIYQIKIIDNDSQTSFSIERSASPNISGVKRTWGSIKAMFR